MRLFLSSALLRSLQHGHFVIQVTFRFPYGSLRTYAVHLDGANLNERNTSRESDLDRLSRLKALSWLSPTELTLLVGALVLANYKRHSVILREVSLAQDAHILLAGIARITCRNARNERVTVAMLAPGPIPEFPALPISQSGFQCEAFNDCRVGSVSWADFDGITVNASESAFRQFHRNDLKQWYRLLLRSSSFLNLGLHERIAIALLELCADFGIEESRGTLLRVSFSHKDIANLVGASRPRVTEHLARLEREKYLVRQGRQMVVHVAKLFDSMNPQAGAHLN
ncbi:Crp/Fnr family transcriptional regulator [Candidatus Binatus sp.]|uniref:Crp/Fnr family transcriptional regulator n=1 Tax=Candidatus Binatus sp. TaxID=2811406 RepID=UPI003CC58EA5